MVKEAFQIKRLAKAPTHRLPSISNEWCTFERPAGVFDAQGSSDDRREYTKCFNWRKVTLWSYRPGGVLLARVYLTRWVIPRHLY